MGRAAKGRTIAFREMRGAVETAGQRDLHHAHFGLQKQVARALQPDVHVIAFGRAPEIARKEPLHLAGRDPSIMGQLHRADRIFEIGLHPGGNRGKAGVAHADARRDRQALLIALGADRSMNHLIGDAGRKIGPLIAGNLAQHQVNRCRPARRRQKGAVLDKDRADERDIGEFLGETVLIFPMDRRAPTIEKPRLGQGARAGT